MTKQDNSFLTKQWYRLGLKAGIPKQQLKDYIAEKNKELYDEGQNRRFSDYLEEMVETNAYELIKDAYDNAMESYQPAEDILEAKGMAIDEPLSSDDTQVLSENINVETTTSASVLESNSHELESGFNELKDVTTSTST